MCVCVCACVGRGRGEAYGGYIGVQEGTVAVWLLMATKSCFDEHPFTFVCSHLAVISASRIIIILYSFP